MSPDRRQLFAAAASLGVGSATFQRALAAQAEGQPTAVTPDMVKAAEWVAGVTLTDDERKRVAGRMTSTLAQTAALAKVELTNADAPAVHFLPAPWQPHGPRGTVEPTAAPVDRPAADADTAFLSVAELGSLLRTKKASSVELTKLYLTRLRALDPTLKFVVSFTEELALTQAKQADEEIAAGRYRGPLHGVPWGAKDLIAVPGYRTTWGAEHYRTQTLPDEAAVYRRLTAAGAVLTAKLTLGALALGDVWYGGVTKNPWNPKQGSSGSSAGSASATVAGAVGFAVGSETLGSIVSPATRCGATGLRPTFGRVSRAGCMTLAWTMDKLGPLGRGVEDCALVFGAIHGADPADPSAVDRPFTWPGRAPLKELRVGVFDGDRGTPKAVRDVLADLGVKLVPIRLPSQLPVGALTLILNAETAAAFDDPTRAGVRDGLGTWATSFRAGRFISAVDYLRANRVRARLMREMATVMETVDLYVGGDDLVLTNFTGHPTVCLPNGFVKRDGVEVPTALTFTGRLYGETELLQVAKAYQDATGFHKRRPPVN